MITLFLMNAAAVYSAYVLVYKIMAVRGITDSLCAFFIMYFSQIVLTELALGLFGKLFLPNLVLLNILIAAFLWGKFRNSESVFPGLGLKQAFLGLISNKLILFLVSLILGFGLVKVSLNLINPPFGWDNLSYHFVFPVEWLKHGNLDTPITICDDPSATYYPINGSLFFLWFMLPLKNVFLADLGQLPFYILAFFSVYGLSRKLGAAKELAFYGAAMFLATPNFFKQVEMAYVDVIFAAVYLAGLYFLICLYQKFNRSYFILWSISFGLLLGIKSSAVVFGLPLLLLFMAIIIKRLKGIGFSRAIGSIALFLAAVIVFGGYSYLRNYLLTGNPLYPAEIKLLGKTIFEGVMPLETYRLQWTKEEFNLGKVLFHEGMGAQFLILFIPCVFISIPLFMNKFKAKKIDLLKLYIFILPYFLCVLFFYFMPQLNLRYGYMILGIGYAISAYVLTLLNLPLAVVRALAVICCLASVSEYSGHGELAASFILSGLLFFILMTCGHLKFKRSISIVLALCGFAFLWLLNLDYNKHEYSRYLSNSPFPKEDREAWFWLNQNTAVSNIAYAGIPHVLPLYGEGFKNRVLYVSVNDIHPAKLHYFKGAQYLWYRDFMKMHKQLEEKGRYRQNPDYLSWLTNLRKERVDYLVVYSLHKVRDRAVFPIENDWARSHPNNFKLAFSKDSVKIYKVNFN